MVSVWLASNRASSLVGTCLVHCAQDQEADDELLEFHGVRCGDGLRDSQATRNEREPRVTSHMYGADWTRSAARVYETNNYCDRRTIMYLTRCPRYYELLMTPRWAGCGFRERID